MSEKFKDWLSDVKDAYEFSIGEFKNGNLNIREIEDLYKIAPLVAAVRKNIVDSELIEEMCDLILKNAEQDFLVDDESRRKYKFHFVISYIHSHVPPNIITEMEGDRIMDYVNSEWNLFD